MIGIVLETGHPSVWCRTAEKVARFPLYQEILRVTGQSAPPPPGGTACMGTYSVPSYLSCLGSFAYFMLVLKFDVFFL